MFCWVIETVSVESDCGQARGDVAMRLLVKARLGVAAGGSCNQENWLACESVAEPNE